MPVSGTAREHSNTQMAGCIQGPGVTEAIYFNRLFSRAAFTLLRRAGLEKGTLTFSNGDVFEGSWVNGRRDGRGVHKLASGAEKSGFWKAGLMHGIGRIRRVRCLESTLDLMRSCQRSFTLS